MLILSPIYVFVFLQEILSGQYQLYDFGSKAANMARYNQVWSSGIGLESPFLQFTEIMNVKEIENLTLLAIRNRIFHYRDS